MIFIIKICNSYECYVYLIKNVLNTFKYMLQMQFLISQQLSRKSSCRACVTCFRTI